ncbi:CBS domain-containing protein [Nocardiopsis sp. NRRL B-16309]|uniref:CBS domain-containing protein n=1 Tax=Nocardiopsis sp. NRRL B-16309 TaxID=1519494 RepID=UPI0006AF3268|nr:CBS domain-containing protein [Nocardiopsis sp. NRRL B-16309]KOX18213.1 oxidoreductase [Nocardiopsis sp. NRRL B-16309]
MLRNISDVMTSPPITVEPSASLREAAEIMRGSDVGDVIVTEGDTLVGVLTDRDIVLRCVAEGIDPDTATARSVCSSNVATVPAQSSLRDAVDVMRSDALRRLPVVEGERVVGVVTMGDLAMAVDSDSALADVSAAPPNH